MSGLIRSLRQQSAFKRLYQKGRRLRGTCLTMCFLSKTTQDNNGFEWAVVASRKTGKAVDRNRLKRRVRVLVQKHSDDLLKMECFSLIAKRPAKLCSYATLEMDVLEFLKQLKKSPQIV